MSTWKTLRNDKNRIIIINRHDAAVTITASRTNPSPRDKYQGWEVYGFDVKGTYFKRGGLNFKKDAMKAITEAKYKWEAKNIDNYR